ncbi:curli assembly protein CsgF [Aureivirga sp. CE67]|uniref:curli assembly protein CsgF n=1 Tax=Aureivirga sp. CE67 TaxID=1788983 RepID=UPI0018C9C617|nr:curli assembly protein CsgF [Aureivirga sp. CE67]
MKRKLLIILFFIPFMGIAQNFVYKPVNPFFGGNNPFSYQQLLASANAQNSFKESSSSSRTQKSDTERFTENLNRQLLNKISKDLFEDEFGEGELEEGTYVFGSLVLDISPSTDGLFISILDTATGDKTEIVIPND